MTMQGPSRHQRDPQPEWVSDVEWMTWNAFRPWLLPTLGGLIGGGTFGAIAGAVPWWGFLAAPFIAAFVVAFLVLFRVMLADAIDAVRAASAGGCRCWRCYAARRDAEARKGGPA